MVSSTPYARTTTQRAQRERRAQTSWDWAPVSSLLTLIASAGILLLSLSYSAGRIDSSWSDLVFWAGLITLIGPLAFRLMAGRISRQEGVAIVLIAAVGFYLVSYLRSPLAVVQFDEFLHWRTANDMLRTGRLFEPNPVLPISPLYPGLEIATTALVNLTGLDIFHAGILLIGAARILLALTMFNVFMHVTGSSKVAVAASLIYMGNTTFVYFDAQFGYESLALPVAIFVVCALVNRSATQDSNVRTGWLAAALIGMLVVAITHHVSSFLLMLLLVGWKLVGIFLVRGKDRAFDIPWIVIGLAIIANGVWIATIWTELFDYFFGIFGSAYEQVQKMVTASNGGGRRQLFKAAATGGRTASIFERLIGLGSVGLIMLGLPIGLWAYWQRYRRNVLVTVFALAALAYPVTLAMRFGGESAWQIANRSSGFLYLALGCVIGLGLIDATPPRWLSNLRLVQRTLQWVRLDRMMLSGVLIIIVVLGGIIAGSSPTTRIPGPYLVAAEERSYESQGRFAALWARDYLGPGNLMVADRTNSQLMLSYGEQYVLTEKQGVIKSGIFLSKKLQGEDLQVFQNGVVRYVVVDRRIEGSTTPVSGYFFEPWERLVVPDAYSEESTIDPQALDKFSDTPGIGRIFDGGDLQIYDGGGLVDAPKP